MSLKPQVVEFEDRWTDVKKVVLNILAGNSVHKKVWTSSFSDVYALCTAVAHSHAPKLYTETKMLFKDHVDSVLKNLKNAEQENILKGYCAYWDLYFNACNIANNLFSYLNTQCQKQQPIKETKETKEENFIENFMIISDTGLKLWSETLLMDDANESGDKDENLRQTLINLVLEEIRRNRQGSFIGNQEVVLMTIKSFQDAEQYKSEEEKLKLFEKSLEEPYLQQVKNFYRQKSLDLMDAMDVEEYIARCLQLLEEEGWRAKRFMMISYDKIISATRQMLVLDHLDFINSHCRAMIENQNEEALSNAYQLLNFSSRAISHMLNEYQDYVEEKTRDVFKGFKEDNVASNLCESLIEIHEQQSKLIKKVFMSHSGFITSLDKGFNNTINKFSRNNNGPPHQKSAVKISPVPDLLVRHCDQLLKKGAKGLNENDLEERLAGVVTIFKYIEDKDVFNKIYSKHLARRLIYSLSQSMDAEEVMIKKLKQVCGHEYTGKLQRMLTDIKISEDLATKFIDSLGSDPSLSLGLSFNILVMQAGAWPLQVPQSAFTIPQELERSLQQFEKFYQLNFNGRKLLWHHTLSTCDVKFNYLNRTYVMHTSLHIMSILVLFNNVDNVSFTEAAATTGIGQEDLTRYLQLLVDNHLIFCDTDKKISLESRFTLNFAYQNKRPKFKLMSQFRESVQETERTLNTVTEDRKMFLQAVIVRTMKARKRMQHKALVEEVVRQSLRHFVPNHSFTKKMIEQLIDKQYLERVEDSIDEYNYIA